MNNELRSRALVCVDFLSKALLGELDDRSNNGEVKGLSSIIGEMAMYLPEFNFYPSDRLGKCREVAFFTSLIGKRWHLDRRNKIPFDEMFKNVIQHCQGSCSGVTQYAAIIIDNWDDDTASFWQSNIESLKRNGIVVEVHLLLHRGRSSFYL